MSVVNNVTRLLGSHKLKYTAYELPAEKLGALETARLLNVDPAVVFKTIVVTRDKPKKPLLVVVPGNSTVDLKLACRGAEREEGLSSNGTRSGGIDRFAGRRYFAAGAHQ